MSLVIYTMALTHRDCSNTLARLVVGFVSSLGLARVVSCCPRSAACLPACLPACLLQIMESEAFDYLDAPVERITGE